MAWTRAALALIAVALLAALALSGASSSDPSTPPALPGLPPPFMSTAVLGEGGLSAGVDSYGDIVDLRAPGPAGRPLIDNPAARQEAGTVSPETGIVPRLSVDGGPALALWRADSIKQRYLPDTNVLRTTARFGNAVAVIECAARGEALGCLGRASGRTVGALRISFAVHLRAGAGLVHLQDSVARRIIGAARLAGPRWLARARSLGAEAPVWAKRLYRRSLLVLEALEDRRSGAIAAGARDGWAYVWPRDAGASAIALASAGYRSAARRAARFLDNLDLNAAARFDGEGRPIPGRGPEGDAWGWAAAAARAAALPPPRTHPGWRQRSDYQEKAPGDYLANALSAGAGRGFLGREGELIRVAGEPASGLDSAAAWAVRPFTQPALFAAVRRTLRRLLAGGGRFGIVPAADWPDSAPWTAPTAWSAWSLAALGERRGALHLLGDLRRAATPTGLLPERVGVQSGIPLSTTPLAWSHAFAILAIAQLWPGRRQRESQ